MRAIVVRQFGDAEAMQVGEVELPQPGRDEVLIRVLAAGVGPWDVSLRRGGLGGALPYIPGGAFAGVVVGDTGADAALDDGAPVYGYPGLTGCYAEYVACPVEQLAPIPAGLPVSNAAATPIDALTAEQGLTDILAVGAGDRILITAAAGGLPLCRADRPGAGGVRRGNRKPAEPSVRAQAGRGRGHRPHPARLA
ncbi:MAG TPA: hypothetical protein VK162_21225 [Streptosporangiaceae bacterium]|nr:hypothetical protein [Streptosporangiaceae bacterium]